MEKRLIALSLLTCLFMSATACDSTDDSADSQADSVSEQEWLTEVSQKAVENLSALTYDDNYVEAYVNSQEITDIVKEWQGAEVKADEVYVTCISESDTKSFMEYSGGFDYSSLTDTAKNSLNKKIVTAVPNYIASRQGVNYTVACSVLNDSVSYAVNYDIANQVWFMPTDKDGLAVCVSFGKTGEGVVTVNSSYLYYGEGESLKDMLDTYIPFFSIEKQQAVK